MRDTYITTIEIPFLTWELPIKLLSECCTHGLSTSYPKQWQENLPMLWIIEEAMYH